MIKHYAVLYIATFTVMMVLDIIWLKGVAQEFYKNRLGDLLDFRTAPAVLFYLMYVVGILVFVSGNAENWQDVLLYGVFFGFLAYATYDFTNLATLKVWTVQLAAVDIAWGVFNTGVSATVGWKITRCLLY